MVDFVSCVPVNTAASDSEEAEAGYGSDYSDGPTGFYADADFVDSYVEKVFEFYLVYANDRVLREDLSRAINNIVDVILIKCTGKDRSTFLDDREDSSLDHSEFFQKAVQDYEDNAERSADSDFKVGKLEISTDVYRPEEECIEKTTHFIDGNFNVVQSIQDMLCRAVFSGSWPRIESYDYYPIMRRLSHNIDASQMDLLLDKCLNGTFVQKMKEQFLARKVADNEMYWDIFGAWGGFPGSWALIKPADGITVEQKIRRYLGQNIRGRPAA